MRAKCCLSRTDRAQSQSITDPLPCFALSDYNHILSSNLIIRPGVRIESVMNNKHLNSLLLIILCFFATFFKPVYADEPNLLVENAWISEAPPVSRVMVAYMTLKNTGEQAIEIVRAESDVYSSIEFHETIHQDGMARMVRYDSLKIAANKKLELKRGGAHLMLFNPTRRLKAGDTVSIKFTTKDNTSKTILVNVKKAQF